MKAIFAESGRKIRCGACGSLLPEAEPKPLCPNCTAERARKSPRPRIGAAGAPSRRKAAGMTRGEFYFQHQPLFVLVVILSIALSVGGLIMGGALGSFVGVALGAFLYLTGPWLILSHRDPPPPRRRPRG